MQTLIDRLPWFALGAVLGVASLGVAALWTEHQMRKDMMMAARKHRH